jgi:GTP diphosphokinase / guanosine-3',5'-bis(diphosphate) 3'-diphosphatase
VGVDLTAGAGALSGGRPLSSRFGSSSRGDSNPEGRFTDRLRAMLPWPAGPGDAVTELVRTHRQIHPKADAGLLRRGYSVAEQMHRGQLRKSGEPYITHPVAVAQILAELGMDTTTLVAALLHDTVEDTEYTLPHLRDDFGPEVELIVDGVTKFDKAFFGASAEAETFRKMLIKASKDVRVLVIKLADRLHNMRTLDARSTASRTRIATVTRDVLVPLADRLGIQALKRELEDTVLWALEPQWYERIGEHVRETDEWTAFLETATASLAPALARAKVDAKILPRPRHYYSIWKDTVATWRRTEVDEVAGVHDLPRVVIVVDGPASDCYAAMGTVHTTFRPVPGRFKDFIASPKNNLYRSLHTTVLGPDRQPLEVLIRTTAMHRSAEYGIVANYRYPEYTAQLSEKARQEQLVWLHKVIDWQQIADDAVSFLDALRCDLTEAQIQVFTTEGRRVQLPAGSTPVDLAYALSAEVGHSCVAARRGGRLVPLSSELSDGDVVEILSSPSAAARPSRDWLTFVRSPAAQLHIGNYFADRGDDEQQPRRRSRKDGQPDTSIRHKVAVGRIAIQRALALHGRSLFDDRPLLTLADDLGMPDVESLAVAVADGQLTALEVAERLVETVDQPPRVPRFGFVVGGAVWESLKRLR